MVFNKESDFEEALIKILSEKGWEKEAIAIMGIVLWKYALPTLLKEISGKESRRKLKNHIEI